LSSTRWYPDLSRFDDSLSAFPSIVVVWVLPGAVTLCTSPTLPSSETNLGSVLMPSNHRSTFRVDK
jgi:hypothetical protein